MIFFAFITSRWFLRLALLALFVSVSTGLAVLLKGDDIAAIMVAVAFAAFFWWCAVFAAPPRASGRRVGTKP